MLFTSLDLGSQKLLVELGCQLPREMNLRKRASYHKLGDEFDEANRVLIYLNQIISQSDLTSIGFDEYDWGYAEYTTNRRFSEGSYVEHEATKLAVKTEGKQVILKYIMEHDLDLSMASDSKFQSFVILGSELGKQAYKNFIDKTVNEWEVWKASLGEITTAEEKNILFLLLVLKEFYSDLEMIELYDYGAKKFQQIAKIDCEYLEELTDIAKKFLRIRKDALEIITE